MKAKLLFLLISAVGLSLLAWQIDPVSAYVASSNNYRLEKDSINFGGGEASSTSYGLGDTIGEIGTGDLSGTTYNLRAGYRAMTAANVFLTISAPDDIILGSISETGGSSSGSAVWTVTTNNSSGYRLSIKSSTNPALVISGTTAAFEDYNPGSNPSYDWQVGATAKAFGFAVGSNDAVDKFKNNGTACGSGSSNSDYCWLGFSTTDETIAEGSAANDPSGTATTVQVRAEAGNQSNVTDGSYSASLTVTAVTL